MTPPAPACALLVGGGGKASHSPPLSFPRPLLSFSCRHRLPSFLLGRVGACGFGPFLPVCAPRFASSAASGVWVLSLRGPRVGRVCAPGRSRGPEQAWDAGGSGALSQAPRAAPPVVFPEPQPQLPVGFSLELLCRLDPAVVGWGRHPAGPPGTPVCFSGTARVCRVHHTPIYTPHTRGHVCIHTLITHTQTSAASPMPRHMAAAPASTRAHRRHHPQLPQAHNHRLNLPHPHSHPARGVTRCSPGRGWARVVVTRPTALHLGGVPQALPLPDWRGPAPGARRQGGQRATGVFSFSVVAA